MALDAQLHAAGLKVTAGRLGVLEQLAVTPHSTADRLHRALGERGLVTSVQSVHNVLADLTAVGLVRRIEPAGSAALYERRVADNHHHVVCRACGAVADIDCVHGEAPCLTPSSTHGFAIDTAEIVFWGTCQACSASMPASGEHPVPSITKEIP